MFAGETAMAPPARFSVSLRSCMLAAMLSLLAPALLFSLYQSRQHLELLKAKDQSAIKRRADSVVVAVDHEIKIY